MNKAVALNTGDEDEDLQVAARRAARREGMSIGEWLDAVVERKAAALGIAAEDLDPTERVNAVTERLKQISTATGARGAARSSGSAGLDARDRRGAPTTRLRETAAAVRAVARTPETSPADRHADDAGSTTVPPRWRELKSLGGRAAAEAAPAASATNDLDDLRQMESRLKALFGTLGPKDADRGARDASAPADPQAGERDGKAGRRKTLSEAIAEIQGRQAALDDPKPAPEAPGTPKAAKNTASRAAASELLDQFSSFGRVRGSSRLKPQPEKESSDVTSLRDDIAALSRTLEDLAPKDAVKSLEAAVRDLSASIEASRDGGLRDMILAPVERLARDLRSTVRELDPKQAVSGLDREIRALGEKIESVTTRGIDAASLKRIQEQTTEVRDLLALAASRPLSFDRVEQQIASLDARIDRIGTSEVPATDASVATALGEVRAAISGFKGFEGVEALERRVDTLAAKMDSVIACQVRPSVIDALAQRIENVQATIDTRSSVDLAPLERMIGGLIGRVDGLQEHQNDLRGLEETVHGLAGRLAEIRDPEANAEVFSALQRQIGQLTQRIDRNDEGLKAIVSVERSLGELFAQLNETREAAINSAEGAARTAARDTLRAAMLDHEWIAPRHGNESVAQVSHELAEFRASRELADERLGLMLSTVNETLEQVMARLVSLEAPPATAHAGERASAAAPKPEPPPPALRPRVQARQAPPAAPPPAGERAPQDRQPDVLDLGEADFPIEPGAAPVRPRPPKASAVPDVKFDPSQFIAAARRAAQTAAQESAKAAPRGREHPAKDKANQGGEPVELPANGGLAAKRRPLLLGLAGLILLVGAVQVARITLSTPAAPVIDADQPSAAVSGGHDPRAPLTPLPTHALATAPEAPAPAAAISVPEAPAAAASLPAAPDTTPAPALPSMAMAPALARAAQHAAANRTDGGLAQGLRDLADGGQPAAEYEMGARYADGRGVARDMQTAATWFQKAADQGLAPAEYRLGSLYEKGLGVTKDPARSLALYEKAAQAGNVRAMHNLAVMSAEGAGGKADYTKAAQWFGKASQMGVRDSQFNLAILYARGLGIEQSMIESYKWFAIAAGQGDEDAAKKRDEVAARLDPKALAAAKQAADDFKPLTPLKAANEVQPPAGGWDALPARASVPDGGTKALNGRATNT